MVLLGAVAAVLIFAALGGRWYIVSTPSMGQAAPVGSLIVTTPSSIEQLRAGDIISFHPPTAPDQVYSHRVHDKSLDGTAHTRGDINETDDPWAVSDNDLVGTATAVLPGVGWLIRSLPLLAVGAILVWYLPHRFAKPAWRAPCRIIGTALIITITAAIIRPFVGLATLATDSQGAGTIARLVSTGLLPTRVTVSGGNYVDLESGQVGSVTVDSLSPTGFYSIDAGVELSWWGWLIAATVCLLPLLWCLIVGLPPAPERDPVPRQSSVAVRKFKWRGRN
jgi:hypothetical protein